MARRKRRNRRRQSSQRKWWAIAMIAIAVVASGVVLNLRSEDPWTPWPLTGEEQHAVCVLLIDRTPSSASDSTERRYQDLALRAVDGCRDRKAKFSVYVLNHGIQKITLINDEAVNLWLPKGRKPTVQENQLEDALDKAKADVASAFAQSSDAVGTSDILGAINEAGKNLDNQADADEVAERHLIVLTDGIQLQSDVTFEVFTDESVEVDQLVQRTIELGLMPTSLKGAQVSFVGVRTGVTNAGSPLPQWFDNKAEQYWQRIIADSGARMCTYVLDSQILPVSC